MARKSSVSIFSLVGGEDSGGGGSGSFVPIAGGVTMTGFIDLAGNATSGLQPVTYQQWQLGLLGLTPLGSAYAATTVADGNKALTGAVTADGQVVPAGEIVNLQFNTDQKENGPWVTAIGAWSRPSNFVNGTNAKGAFISIVNGPTYGATVRIQITNPAIVGTDNLVWDFQAFQTIFADGTTIADNAGIFSIANGGILNVHVNAAAAIAGTKISPNFGAQTVQSTGPSLFQNLQIQGTAGAGWIDLPSQTVEPADPSAGESRLFSDSFGWFSVKKLGGQRYSFDNDLLFSDRVYQLQDLSHIIANVPASGFVTSDGSTLSSQASIPFSNVTGTVPIANGGTGVTTFTTGSIPFMGATTLEQNNDSFFWDSANEFLGLGTFASPVARLTVGSFPNLANYGTISPDAVVIQSIGGGIEPVCLFVEGFAGYNNNNGGTIGLGARNGASAMSSGNRLGGIDFYGSDDGFTGDMGAKVQAITAGSWTVASHPTHVEVYTTPSASLTPVLRTRVTNAGNFLVNTTTVLGTISVFPVATNTPGLGIRGLAGQSGNLIEVTDSTSALMFRVTPTGSTHGVAFRTLGTAGSGFVQLSTQSADPSAVTTTSLIYSNASGHLTVRTGVGANIPYSFSNANLTTTARTYTLQDSSHIIANVPSAGVVTSNGVTLSAGNVNLASDVGASVLPMANGGTNSASIAAGLVTSNGTTLSSVAVPSAGIVSSDGSSLSSIPMPSSGVVVSNGTTLTSYFRQALTTTVTQSVATTTPTVINELVSTSLQVGTYRVSGVLVFQSTAVGTGVGFRLNAVAASISAVHAKFRVSQAANGTAKDYVYDQLSTATNVTSTSVQAANTDAVCTFEAIVEMGVSNPLFIEMRSETGTSVSIRANSFIEITAI